MCLGPTHRIGGVAAWLAAAPHLGVTDPRHLAAGAVIAGACGHGQTHPIGTDPPPGRPAHATISP